MFASISEFIASLALTVMLTVLAIYFVWRAGASRHESAAIWGATAATTALAGLSSLTTVGASESWVQASLRVIAVAGILEFWFFYRVAVVSDRKKPKVGA
jgi:hypothetical protein